MATDGETTGRGKCNRTELPGEPVKVEQINEIQESIWSDDSLPRKVTAILDFYASLAARDDLRDYKAWAGKSPLPFNSLLGQFNTAEMGPLSGLLGTQASPGDK